MWFLLRVAFWLSLVITLLPTAPSQQFPVKATDASSAASATVSDVRQFCVRQPGACATGSQAIVQFGHKAQASAKLLYQFLDKRIGTDQSAVSAKGTDKSTQGPSQGTLTPADLAVPSQVGFAVNPRHWVVERRMNANERSGRSLRNRLIPSASFSK